MASIKELEWIFSVTPDNQAIMLVSDLGMGKSEFITSYWSARGYKVICVHGAEMADAGDICGLPDREIVNGIKRTIFAPPAWFPIEDNDEKICLFCDEINRSKPEVLASFHDMILNRTLNGRNLSKHTRIIAAINPNKDDGINYHVDDLDPAFMDRFNVIPFQPTKEEWIDWALKNKVNKYILGFIAKNAATYLDPPTKMKTGEVYPSRRSWKRLSDILNNNSDILTDVDYKLKLIASTIVGIGATSKFSMYVKENMKGINVGSIVTNWNKELETTIKCMPNQDLVNVNSELALYLEQNENDIFLVDQTADKYAHNVYRYLSSIPKEVMSNFFSLINEAANNNKSWQNNLLLHSKELVKYFSTCMEGKSKEEKEFETMINDTDNDSSEEWKNN